MPNDARIKDLMAAFEKTAYFRWMRRQAIPVVDGYAVEDVREVKLSRWDRTGGNAAFLNLYGMEGVTGMYVGEIPGGGALSAEKHFYEEVICILEGTGATEIWQQQGRKQMFEWGPWSLFALPLNTSHRLINGGRQPVKYLAVTNAPLMMDIIHNEEFLFDCPYDFTDRYSGAEGFFNVGEKRYESGMQHIWETNFIADIQTADLGARDVKGSGVRITQFELAGNGLIGHLAQWPAGRYHKAHYHGPGAILFGLQSSGYVLLWSKELGTNPFQGGHEDDVVEVKWKAGSVYCPPGGLVSPAL